jgi:catechol 2,3-dioxygenase-like lactoylglutathione lyase family enzyme
VKRDNGVSLDFANAEGPIRSQHHCAGRRRAFSFMPSLSARQTSTLSSGRIHKRRIDHWADPMRRHPGEINHTDGGRGVYFPDPDGHQLEVITRPYGSGAS